MDPAKVFLAFSLIIIMFGMGLSLKVDDFRRILLQPRAIILGLFNQIILLPLSAYFLLMIFKVEPVIAVGVILLAACPGGPTSNLITHLSKGDTSLSVSLTAFSSVLTIFTIPIIVQYGLDTFGGESQEIVLNVPRIIGQLVVITILPVAIGMFIYSKREPFAIRMEKPVKIASGIVLSLVIIALIIKERENVGSYFEQAGIITLALNVLTMFLGYGTAKLFKLNTTQSISISIESGIQNGTLAIAIAGTILTTATNDGLAYAIAPSIYSLLMFITGFIVIGLRARK